MFGRRTDDTGGGRDGNGEGDRPRGDGERAGARETDGSVFAEGIRVETSRRRTREPDDEGGARASADDAAGDDDGGESRAAVTRYSEPIPAVPPTAGGAHRAAAYRQAPSQTESDAPAEQPAEQPEEQPDATAAAAGPEQGVQAMADGDDSKRLTVGQGIRLKGEISNCDSLLVLGNVEADLSQCRSIQVGESGHFNGTVRVEEAVIAGQFQGKLVVSGVLSIKSTGKVRGEVRYGALQVESGGVLAGSADTNEAGASEDEDAGDAARATFGTRQTPAGGDG